ncbi:MAG: N-6 DNA methylase [Candidatus Anaerobiospirillum pullicola]|uniref:site-specific DNA-methyltransferase (adenine-specific) n=1 Tax=Candidatus Anaerobiospirillum pullicola TaxID=2838451 RepID=A0A948TH71_9GAMM|nr:N-6 DNA methylase [Candidatus Anaerobiospirillum pullicola]
MDYQDWLEQTYLKLTTKEHRKSFAQFFTPPAIATLMAAYILDNPHCRTVLDPAAGLSIFAAALDENLRFLNQRPQPYWSAQGRWPYSATLEPLQSFTDTSTLSPMRSGERLHHSLVNYLGLIVYNSEELNYFLSHKFLSHPPSSTPDVTSAHGTATHDSADCRELAQLWEQDYWDLSGKLSPEHSYGRHMLTPRISSLCVELKSVCSFTCEHAYSAAPFATAMTSAATTAQVATKPESSTLKTPHTPFTATYDTDYSRVSQSSSYHYAETAEAAKVPAPRPLIVDESWHSLTLGSNHEQRKITVTAYEIDAVILEFNRFFFDHHPFGYIDYHLHQRNYLKANFKERYDGIICNPPYQTTKGLPKESQLVTLLEERLNMTLPKKMNLYALFLLKSLSQLSAKGRCAYLIPYEFLNSSFGVCLKEEFIRQRHLAYVITFKEQIFDNATTTCGLFLFDKAQRHDEVEFITVNSLSELEQLTLQLCPNLLAVAAKQFDQFQLPGLILEPVADNASLDISLLWGEVHATPPQADATAAATATTAAAQDSAQLQDKAADATSAATSDSPATDSTATASTATDSTATASTATASTTTASPDAGTTKDAALKLPENHGVLSSTSAAQWDNGLTAAAPEHTFSADTLGERMCLKRQEVLRGPHADLLLAVEQAPSLWSTLTGIKVQVPISRLNATEVANSAHEVQALTEQNCFLPTLTLSKTWRQLLYRLSEHQLAYEVSSPVPYPDTHLSASLASSLRTEQDVNEVHAGTEGTECTEDNKDTAASASTEDVAGSTVATSTASDNASATAPTRMQAAANSETGAHELLRSLGVDALSGATLIVNGKRHSSAVGVALAAATATAAHYGTGQEHSGGRTAHPIQGRLVPYTELNAKQKWHIYYQQRDLHKHFGEVNNSHTLLSNLSTFDQFIKVKRGLATGANDFFLFTRAKMAEVGLDEQYFVPVIPRANLVSRPIFTAPDFEALAAADAPVFLLNAPDVVEDDNLKRYLQYGEEQQLHQRYLTRHRCPWYTLERREVAPILMSVFNRGTINVVRNEAQIYNLTTFHSIFVLDEANTDLIFAYLLTPLAKDIIMQNRREYGGGLEKLEPLDINHAVCVNFAAMSEKQRSKILELYGQYRMMVLNADPAAALEQAIAAISAEFMDVIKEQ